MPVTSLPSEKFDVAVNQMGTNEPCIPLLCAEACNLLVARAREVVKQRQSRAVTDPARPHRFAHERASPR